MKIQTLFLFACLCFFGVATAQNSKEWKPVLNSPDGTNDNVGVVATYSLTNCIYGEVVLLKLVNNNARPLRAQWIHLVQTKDGKQLFGNAKQISLNLAAKSENTGDCSGNTIQLMIRLSDFGIKAENFETYIASNFSLYSE
jgi:hypothetical protein